MVEDGAGWDLWAEAYRVAQGREPELMVEYARHLPGRDGAQGALTAQSVEAIVKKLLENRAQKQWSVSLFGKDVKVRKQVEKLAKFLLWSDDIVKSAVSAQPYAALAWSAVSMLLPVRFHLTSIGSVCLSLTAPHERFRTARSYAGRFQLHLPRPAILENL